VIVDVFAILATVFGIATSLGLGASQISAGLEHLILQIVFGYQWKH